MFALYWGYIGIMEKKMETTIWGLGFGVLGLGFRYGHGGLLNYAVFFVFIACSKEPRTVPGGQ